MALVISVSRLGLLLVIVCQFHGSAAGQQSGAESAWEPDIRLFEEEDRVNPPPAGAVLFAGSSSIRMWDSLEAHFPGVPIIQRGFGGSHMHDLLEFAPRIVIPYLPRLVVVYEGDNDISSGKSPEQVAFEFEEFVEIVRGAVPDVRFAFISIKPSPARREHLPDMERANRLIRELADRDARMAYIDVWTPMLDYEGEPRRELFLEDALHLSGEGYTLWRSVIAPYLD